MNSNDRKKLNTATKADLMAKKFVLNERLARCKDPDEAIEIVRLMSLADHHLECIGNRVKLQFTRTASNDNLKARWSAASKEGVVKMATR